LKAAANKLKKPAVSRADMAANRKKKPTGHGPSRQGSAASLVAESEEKKEAKSEPPVQCYGPECVNAAVPTSKYCSHECGMKLAKTRLINYLRTHFNDLSSQHNKQQQQSDSDQLNLNELEKINNEVDKLKKRLVELEQKHLELDKIIERAKFANINPNVEVRSSNRA
jgi:COMPASS component SPP1